ncbi:hypothetical protein ABT404_02525 [Streptomyces hyaluromycini]|uniref:Uncharacterized protein n=1 Tax=Streptomyces hyaluromycini TaxID=1377993 RepID=A0ABV1WNI3_9ACTN
MAGVAAPAFAHRYPEAIAQMSHWLAADRLTSVEDAVHGDIETFPAALTSSPVPVRAEQPTTD